MFIIVRYQVKTDNKRTFTAVRICIQNRYYSIYFPCVIKSVAIKNVTMQYPGVNFLTHHACIHRRS